MPMINLHLKKKYSLYIHLPLHFFCLSIPVGVILDVNTGPV